MINEPTASVLILGRNPERGWLVALVWHPGFECWLPAATWKRTRPPRRPASAKPWKKPARPAASQVGPDTLLLPRLRAELLRQGLEHLRPRRRRLLQLHHRPRRAGPGDRHHRVQRRSHRRGRRPWRTRGRRGHRPRGVRVGRRRPGGHRLRRPGHRGDRRRRARRAWPRCANSPPVQGPRHEQATRSHGSRRDAHPSPPCTSSSPGPMA